MKASNLTVAMIVLASAAAVALAVGPTSGPAGSDEQTPCIEPPRAPARTLVWSTPGTSESALTPGNWVEYASAADYEAGKPGKAATAAPDAETDLILPAAPDGQAYSVGCMVPAREWRKAGKGPDDPTLSARHVTIGAGAALDAGMGIARGKPAYSQTGGDDRVIAIAGNVTVADGGALYGRLCLVGEKDTSLAIGKTDEPFARSLTVHKAPSASVTIMAASFDLIDGVTVETGRLVLAPATTLRINAGDKVRIERRKLRRASYGRLEPYLWVQPKAALEMHGGSRIGRANAPGDVVADVRLEGLLHVVAGPHPAVIELTAAEGDGGYLNQPGGLYIQPTAQVRNAGALVITAGNVDEEMPAEKRISIFLEAPVDLGKVRLDYLRRGGIAATGPAVAKKALAAATFGEHCAATGDALHSKIARVDFAGGAGTVEFVDGLKTECEILYPLGDRLIVRSKGNRIAQSFDLAGVRAVEIAGRRTEFNPRRALTAAEKKLREVNALWGDVPGDGQIGAYGKQPWPRRPLMVWRHPGRSGSRFNAANWLDATGRPYFQLPVRIDGAPDAPDVDILLPAAKTFYQAAGDRPEWRIRHVAVENNAFFHLTYNITGNLWMKDGGGMHAPWNGKYVNHTPGLHRFLRFDGLRTTRPRGRGKPPERTANTTISQWAHYETGQDATLEVIGEHLVTDHFFVGGPGRMIMSEGSHLAPQGARAPFWIQPGATVVLLQDARIGVESTAMDHACISVLVGGTLMIGTPERPITRDMPFPIAGIEDKEINRDPGENMRASGVSLLVGKEGRLIVHSADPTKARVVFRMYDTEQAKAHGKRWGDPQGIVLCFQGAADLNGVVFDNILEGGIMATPAQRARWKNVTYGQHNLAATDKLYWQPAAEPRE